jgi:hypothetical protein
MGPRVGRVVRETFFVRRQIVAETGEDALKFVFFPGFSSPLPENLGPLA